MSFAQRTIADPATSPASEPFKFRAEALHEPSTFEFRFLAEERVFSYGFDILSKKVMAEWLCVRRGDDDIILFERDATGKATYGTKFSGLIGDEDHFKQILLALVSIPLREDQLLLNRIVGIPETVQGQTLGAIVRWLTKDLVILKADHRATDLLDRLYGDSDFFEFASGFLKNAGTGVGGLQFYEVERDPTPTEARALARNYRFPGPDRDIRPKTNDATKVIERRLVAEHPCDGGEIAELPFSEESDGTQQLLHLMPVLDSPCSGGKVVVIDELDRSLHPLICWEFIRFFSETCPGTHKQLIVTTHEAHLLNQELLRRDEYWFVEKDKNQQTKLVSLADFKVRNDLHVEKGYLQGRFGAVPVIGSMEALEKLLQCRITPEASNAAQDASN
jgi:hypothetical protein